MPRTIETRPLLLTLVTVVSVLVHVPVLVCGTMLFPNDQEALEDLVQIDPLDFVLEEERKELEDTTHVSLDKPEDEAKDNPDAKYADRYNQKVEADKETVRKRATGAAGRPIVAAAPRRNRAKTSPPPGKDLEVKRGETAAHLEDGEGLKAKDVEKRDMLPPTEAPPAQDNATPLDAEDILPNINNLMGAAGGGGIKDYLDVPDGDKDLLNRKKVRYWAYVDRMKSAIQQHWNPNGVFRTNDPRKQIYGVEDRLTTLKVTLNGDGSVLNLFVENPSGVPFLDNEAVRAFREASPFPNPPEAMKDERGLISFRFGFFLNIQSSGSRILRFRR